MKQFKKTKLSNHQSNSTKSTTGNEEDPVLRNLETGSMAELGVIVVNIFV